MFISHGYGESTFDSHDLNGHTCILNQIYFLANDHVSDLHVLSRKILCRSPENQCVEI